MNDEERFRRWEAIMERLIELANGLNEFYEEFTKMAESEDKMNKAIDIQMELKQIKRTLKDNWVWLKARKVVKFANE